MASTTRGSRFPMKTKKWKKKKSKTILSSTVCLFYSFYVRIVCDQSFLKTHLRRIFFNMFATKCNYIFHYVFFDCRFALCWTDESIWRKVAISRQSHLDIFRCLHWRMSEFFHCRTPNRSNKFRYRNGIQFFVVFIFSLLFFIISSCFFAVSLDFRLSLFIQRKSSASRKCKNR